ncbi:hypothetical protein [Actinocorallia herbida]|uniref:hypothetical protein n=1 Tax=Actinocorallia herbida TaxID=58109 RepID=UPI001FE722B2|nr:hypothetical protein [Actinocorallia herbida]
MDDRNGKKLLFHEGTVWLRERNVLLPGVSRLARLARVRDEATDRLHEALHGVLSARQRTVLEQVWEAIDEIVSRKELREAVEAVTDMVPPPGADPDGEVRALLAARISTVSGFVKTLTTVIEFGATAEAQRVLAAMKQLPRLLDGRKKKVTQADIDPVLVSGSWQRLVFKTRSDGSTVDKNAYVMCVLTQSTGTCAAGTSTRRPPPGGRTRAASSWTARSGRPPKGRRSPTWACRKRRASSWPSTPSCCTRRCATSPHASGRTASARPSTSRAGCMWPRCQRCPSRRRCWTCASGSPGCCRASTCPKCCWRRWAGCRPSPRRSGRPRARTAGSRTSTSRSPPASPRRR